MTPGSWVLLIRTGRFWADTFRAALRAQGLVADVAADAEEALALLPQEGGFVVLVHASAGVPTVRQLKDGRPDLQIVVLGVDAAEDHLISLIESGAQGFVSKTASLPELIDTIRSVRAGQPVCSPQVMTAVCARLRQLAGASAAVNLREELSERQREVLELVSQGLSNKEIARKLGITLQTVKNHVHLLLRKLGVCRRRDAIRYARGQGRAGPHTTQPMGERQALPRSVLVSAES